MSSVTINTSSTSLSQCLAEDIDPSTDIKVVDYVVNAGFLDEVLDFTNQEESSIVIEVVLQVDIEKLVTSLVSGYDLEISNIDTGDSMVIPSISFIDDFEDIINTGEADYETIIQKINDTRQLLVYESTDAPPSPGAVYSDRGPQFVDLQDTSSFTTLAKQFLLNGVSIDDTIELQMPLYAVASAATGIGGTIGNGDLSKTDGIITYLLPFSDRLSLSKIRSKYASETAESTTAGAQAMLSVPFSTGLEGTATNVVVGQYMKFTSPLFESKRRIELPKNVWRDGTNSLRFTFTPNFRNISESSTVEPNPTILTYDFSTHVNNFFIPEIPPKVDITRNDFGNVSLSVHRGDPANKSVEISTSYYDIDKGEHKNYGDSILIDFDASPSPTCGTNVYNITNHNCLNYGPYIGSIQAISHTSVGVGLSTETIIPSVKHKHYDKYHFEDSPVVTCLNQPTGIVISVTNANIEGATEFAIMREDLTSSKSTINSIKSISINSPSESFSAFDDEALKGKTYRYYLLAEIQRSSLTHGAQTMYEKVRFSSDFVITRKYYPDTLYTPNVSSMGSEVKPPAFKLQTTLSLSVYDKMIQAANLVFEQQKISAEDAGSALSKIVTDSPDELTKFISYGVTRVNLNTGDQVFLGNFMDGEIVVDPDPEYSLTSAFRYIFRMSVISPLGLAFLAGGALDKAAYFLEKQFIESTGVLPNIVVPETFDASSFSTGQEQHIDVSPILPVIKVGTLTSSSFASFGDGKPALKLTWDVEPGTNFYVKSYYVMCKYNGHTNVLKTLHASSVSTVYSYIDTEYFNEVGSKTYYVVVQMKDMSFAHKTNEIKHVKHFDMSVIGSESSTVKETATDKGLEIPLSSYTI